MIDLYSRRAVGWSMQSRQTTDLVLQALLMAVWRRKPDDKVLIHSDQCSQFTSMAWAAFIRAHNLEHSISRLGNCHDNAVVESFFNLLKRERIRRRTYLSRDEARQDVFVYIEALNSKLRSVFPFIERVWADGGSNHVCVTQTASTTVEIVSNTAGQSGFVILLRRWFVKRFFAWVNRNRRLAMDVEATLKSAAAFFYAAAMLMICRLARSA